MQKHQRILLISALCFLWTCPAGAYNILALDMGGYWNNPFDQYFGAQEGSGVPGALGERWFTRVGYQDLPAINLGDYDVFLVQSAFTDDWVGEQATGALAALNAKSSEIRSYLEGGGGLVAWAEPFPNQEIWGWDWAPVGLSSRGVQHENAVEVVGQADPVMGGATGQSLSDWHSSWHGWFEEWDPRLSPVAQTGDYGAGDPRTHRALTLAGSYGQAGFGRMVFSMQDPDYHAYQGVEGAKGLIGGALDWAGTPVEPVPEPASGILVFAGLGAAAILRYRHRRRA